MLHFNSTISIPAMGDIDLNVDVSYTIEPADPDSGIPYDYAKITDIDLTDGIQSQYLQSYINDHYDFFINQLEDEADENISE